MRLIANIARCAITELDDGSVVFTSKADIDDDGSDNSANDPCWQPNTSLRFKGRSIDADRVPYVVVPPAIIRGVKGIVLGCKARVSYKGMIVDAVVADVGPSLKLGEISMECARRLGINPSPISGGVDAYLVHYTLWPGIPAVVDGVTYLLQPC